MTKSIALSVFILLPVLLQLSGCKKKEPAITKPVSCFLSSVKDEEIFIVGNYTVNYDNNLKPTSLDIGRFTVTKATIAYNNQGNISKINTVTTPDDKLNAELTFSYDSQSRLTNVSEFLVSQNKQYRNTTFEYNSEGKIVVVKTIFRNFRIEYNSSGNVSKIFEVASTGKEDLLVENLKFDTNASPFYHQSKAVKEYWLFRMSNDPSTKISYLLSPNNLLEADWHGFSGKIANTTNNYIFDASNNTATSFKHKIKFYQSAAEYETNIPLTYLCNP